MKKILIAMGMLVSSGVFAIQSENVIREGFVGWMDFCAGRRGVNVQPADVWDGARKLIELGITNGMSTNAVALLAQSLIKEEYAAYRKHPEEQREERLRHYQRCYVLFGVLEYVHDPISLDFLDGLRQEKSDFQWYANYSYMRILGTSDAAVIRRELADPEKAARINLSALCTNMFWLGGTRHMKEKDIDERLLGFAEHLDKIQDLGMLLSVDKRLLDNYPEYATSVQRLAVWRRISNDVPPGGPEWITKRIEELKGELAELVTTPPEDLTDMRQRFKNLPAPAAAEKEE